MRVQGEEKAASLSTAETPSLPPSPRVLLSVISPAAWLSKERARPVSCFAAHLACMSFFGRTYPRGSLLKWAQVNECCRQGLAEQFSEFNTHMARSERLPQPAF